MKYTEALGIDLGTKRIGIARVSSIARLPEPVTTLEGGKPSEAITEVLKLVEELQSDVVVLGLPRNLEGEDTKQTQYTREFADTLRSRDLHVIEQDEALTSKLAEDLIAQGVYRRNMRGAEVTTDEVAACLILKDFIGETETNV